MSPGDIVIYRLVCVLALLLRLEFKAQLLENLSLRVYIEQELHVWEIIEAYMASNFKGVLETWCKGETGAYYSDDYECPCKYVLLISLCM